MARTACLACGAPTLASIIDLGLHPFADRFLKPEELAVGETLYPLICTLCATCGHVQLSCETDPMDRYVNHDYSYTSSNSEGWRTHWQHYAAQVSEQSGLSRGGLVVEIGSNDGFLAQQFMERGHPVSAVDASPVMARLARARGVETHEQFFDAALATSILAARGPAELIIANNVFNHVDAPAAFLSAVRDLLSPRGTFAFEVPYWKVMIASGKFDQIYHEHVSYFTVASAQAMLQRAGMAIDRVEVVPSHGGSLRIQASRSRGVRCEDAARMAEEETRLGLFDTETYRRFTTSMYTRRVTFLRRVYDIKSEGGVIIGIGAAAKGNTLLNFYNLDVKTISFVTDASAEKQGKFTPGSRIPIVSDDVFGRYDDVHALILPWNMSGYLKQVLLKINARIRFITPWED